MVFPFSDSYPDYDKILEEAIFPGARICEIGPSGKPSIRSSEIKRRNLDYTIIDVETTHWSKYNPEVQKFKVDLQMGVDEILKGQFDLVISQMVLEHIEFPEMFHANILKLLRKDGQAIHLYANSRSLSAVVNRWLPEKVGERILKVLGNRNLGYDQKYPAFYRWCYVPSKEGDRAFSELGYQVVQHRAYVGHNYFQNVPVLKHVENMYGYFLLKFNFIKNSTLSLLHVKRG